MKMIWHSPESPPKIIWVHSIFSRMKEENMIKIAEKEIDFLWDYLYTKAPTSIYQGIYQRMKQNEITNMERRQKFHE